MDQQLAAMRQIIRELQRDLLPAALPVLPRIRLAAHYAVAAPELHAGGDWFDALPLPDGRLALVVGDVVGHGAVAAAAMAQLRTVLREALLAGDSLTGAVDRLDRYAVASPATRAATVCVASLDPSPGTFTWISRAHPPPLVCAPDGKARFLDTGRAAPLGLGLSSAPPATAFLEPGSVVLLYSDGLVQRTGETIADGLSRLARVASTALTSHDSPIPGPAERLCGSTVEQIAGATITDDVTALAACLLPSAPEPLALSGPASARFLSSVRPTVTTWLLTSIGADPEDEQSLSSAVHEAAANAIHHSGAGKLRITLSLEESGEIRAVIADDGAWRDPPPGACGRGLPLIHAGGAVELNRGPGGTTAVIRRKLSHAAVQRR